MLGLIIGLTNSTIASAEVGGSVTESFTLDVVADTGDADPPPGDGGAGDGGGGAGGGGEPEPDPCVTRPNEAATWLPSSAEVPPSTLFPTYSGAVTLYLGFQRGWNCTSSMATTAAGTISTEFDITGVDWQESSTCGASSCALPGTLFDFDAGPGIGGRVFANFRVPNDATTGQYSGTFSVTWIP